MLSQEEISISSVPLARPDGRRSLTNAYDT
ncbi:MAG: hypothetical protein QOH28_1321, partial [Actinomycetota bacterium]|nr:hypothetical protein [Actinomycetota bacterium]